MKRLYANQQKCSKHNDTKNCKAIFEYIIKLNNKYLEHEAQRPNKEQY
jgi:hypothetical protein